MYLSHVICEALRIMPLMNNEKRDQITITERKRDDGGVREE